MKLATLLTAAAMLQGATFRVGPAERYRTPCQAIAKARSGDVIEIDAAGSYTGDVCAWRTDRLTLRGAGGVARIDAGGAIAEGKAIWVIHGNGTVVENMEFTGARCSSRNGAGIRLDGSHLVVRRCRFLDNENGILTGARPDSEVLIEYSEFAHNGHGDGYSHNLYIGAAARLTFRYNYSHDANGGHLLKSRAAENLVLCNRLSNEADGTSSFELDVPNGGRTIVSGNVVVQSAGSVNGSIVSYLAEGPSEHNPSHELILVNNTFVNQRNEAVFLLLSPRLRTPPRLLNNIFSGAGVLTNRKDLPLELAGNFIGDPGFVDAAMFDYRLRPGSAAANRAIPIPAGLMPGCRYLHPACAEPAAGGSTDPGAYGLRIPAPFIGSRSCPPLESSAAVP